ncbi:MAG: glycosyltransferase family 4 protein [Pyrinomonadaceae bacterium]
MKIALDGLPLSDTLTGVGHYTLELARHLARSSADEVFVVSPRGFIASMESETGSPTNLHLTRPTISPLTRYWWSIGLPRYIRKNEIEIFHGTNFEVPLRGKCPSVITIHDLSMVLHPQTHNRRRVRRARQRLPIMARTATMVVTPSEAVRQEVHQHLEIPLDRIVTIPEAARSTFHRQDPELTDKVRKRLEITTPFVLYVGTVEPRKNLLTLVRAFEDVLSASDFSLQLVIAGRKGWMVDDLFRHVKQSPAAEQIIFTGYLSDDDLCALYSSCVLFVYLSLYEGFGLPPLEAMACGAPVIASRIPSLTETVGEAALLVSPTDVRELALNIRSLLQDEAVRTQLARKGRQRVSELSWDRTARLTRAVYDQALARTAR